METFLMVVGVILNLVFMFVSGCFVAAGILYYKKKIALNTNQISSVYICFGLILFIDFLSATIKLIWGN